ncbi:hypothetical protein [Lactococcus lactis]|uniref:hypothetical protein n=1 Tax=Lactococcus lactis TaxID=1358 RepID=UPI001651F68D|nr:hypothetical protein [Lactococcus lactis]QNL91924.1 hypothetical protein HUG14_00015 [Lactococcus lactis]
MNKKVIPSLMCSLLLIGSLNNSISVLASDVTKPQLESFENKDTKSNLTDVDSNTGEGSHNQWQSLMNLLILGCLIKIYKLLFQKN